MEVSVAFCSLASVMGTVDLGACLVSSDSLDELVGAGFVGCVLLICSDGRFMNDREVWFDEMCGCGIGPRISNYKILSSTLLLTFP